MFGARLSLAGVCQRGGCVVALGFALAGLAAIWAGWGRYPRSQLSPWKKTRFLARNLGILAGHRFAGVSRSERLLLNSCCWRLHWRNGPGYARLVPCPGDGRGATRESWMRRAHWAPAAWRISSATSWPTLCSPSLCRRPSGHGRRDSRRATLSFLGLGMSGAHAKLGSMLNDARFRTCSTRPIWLAVPCRCRRRAPCSAFNFLGDATKGPTGPAQQRLELGLLRNSPSLQNLRLGNLNHHRTKNPNMENWSHQRYPRPASSRSCTLARRSRSHPSPWRRRQRSRILPRA